LDGAKSLWITTFIYRDFDGFICDLKKYWIDLL
jgi:hypothetical protein